MARTVIGINDAKAVKRYGASLAVDTAKESYFGQKFMGEGETAQMPIQRLTELDVVLRLKFEFADGALFELGDKSVDILLGAKSHIVAQSGFFQETAAVASVFQGG